MPAGALTVARDLLGLMSGTSMDGVDVARVRVSGRLPDLRAACLAFRTVPYPRNLAADLRRVAGRGASFGELADLDRRVADAFSRAAAPEIRKGGISAVGSHGQTVFHRARRGARPAATLQIGDGDAIAERLGVPVVSDFRRRDIAAGGHGAPLTPFADWILFGRWRRGGAVLNIGGIANLTVLAPRLAGVRGFDAGPGNCLLDAEVRRASGGRKGYDANGRLAADGRADERVLARFLRHPFFGARPPKSTGPEVFSPGWCGSVRGFARLPLADRLATLAELTARSVAEALRRFAPRRVKAVWVAGGGAENQDLMRRLARACAPLSVCRSEAAGVPARAREAMAFALLAEARLAGFPAGLPAVTGSRRACVLGKLSPGR